MISPSAPTSVEQSHFLDGVSKGDGPAAGATTMSFFVNPNRPDLDAALFAEGANWFVTKGDADQDRP